MIRVLVGYGVDPYCKETPYLPWRGRICCLKSLGAISTFEPVTPSIKLQPSHGSLVQRGTPHGGCPFGVPLN